MFVDLPNLLKNIMRKALQLLLITIFSLNLANASHIIGGDLTYECLGGNDYKIIMTLYRDCSGIPLDNDESLEIISSCTATQNIDLVQVDLDPTNPSTTGIIDTGYLCSDILNTPGSTTCDGGDYPGVFIHKYEAIVNLADCSDWLFRWGSCCRNPAYQYPALNACGQNHNDAITRVTNPDTWGMRLEATMDNSDGNCNSSPNFLFTPRAFVCQGQEVFIDNGGVDPDGDSLVYELVAPLDDVFGNPTPADTIDYEPGFSSNSPLTLVPGTSFDLNTTNGSLVFYPRNYGAVCNDNDTLEQSSMAVKIYQYRNGVVVGSTIRDIQIVTLPGCDPLEPVNLGIQTVSLPESFINDTTARICAGDTLEFSIRISDFENKDPFDIQSNLEFMIPGSEFFVDEVLDSIGFHSYGYFRIYPTNEDADIYYFNVTAENSGCPVEITKVFDFTLEVVARTIIEVNLDTTCVNQPEDTIILSATGGDNFAWSVRGVNDTTWAECDTCPETQVTPPRTVDYIVTSDLDVPNCPNTDTVRITRVQDPIPLPDFCYEDTLRVEWEEYRPSKNIIYTWNDDLNLDEFSVFVDPEGDSTYFYVAQDTVDFSDSIVCQWRDTNVVSACPVIVPNIFTPNGDLYNEYFKIDNINTEVWNLQIYNRWGKNLIKEFRDYQNDWDGGDLKDGTYFYRLFSQQGAIIVEHKGWFVIAR